MLGALNATSEVLISCRIFIDTNVIKLSNVSKKATWKKFLENEKMKTIIEPF